jgi:hypothetical protein
MAIFRTLIPRGSLDFSNIFALFFNQLIRYLSTKVQMPKKPLRSGMVDRSTSMRRADSAARIFGVGNGALARDQYPSWG